MTARESIRELLVNAFALRNAVSSEYFPRHCEALAATCRQMADRFRRGGRLLAVGRGCYATDAQHVSVEFVHPVIVGKRALPALDASADPESTLESLARPDDIAMGFASPEGDARFSELFDRLAKRGVLTCLWPGHLGQAPLPAASDDAFIHQELVEVMYHTLWETVHVFLEHDTTGHAEDADLGPASFLYPFLAGKQEGAASDTQADVARSICQKARDVELLRALFAAQQSERFAETALALAERIDKGGTLLVFGNGGSATDANDFVLDCVAGSSGMRPIPAISFSAEPAVLSALGNDVGVELMFLRQLLANSRPGDAVVAISTSGASRNIAAALAEARKRGLLTVGLAGYDGGDFVRQNLVDQALVARSDCIPRIQEVQASIYHVLRQAIDLARSPA